MERFNQFEGAYHRSIISSSSSRSSSNLEKELSAVFRPEGAAPGAVVFVCK
jgi:hypothetical protein